MTEEVWSLTLVFAERERALILKRAHEVADPSLPSYGAYLARDELNSLVLLPESERRMCTDWLAGHGMSVVDAADTNRQLAFVRGTESQAREAFQVPMTQWLERLRDKRGIRLELHIPRRLAGFIQKIAGIPGERGQAGTEISGLGPAVGDPPPISFAGAVPVRPGQTAPPAEIAGYTPADIRRMYNFPDRWDGSGETIAILLLGGSVDRSDLEVFWRAHGIDPPEISVVAVGPQSQRSWPPFHVAEATTTVQWASAMAPGARFVLYTVDPTIIGDPWAGFLFAVIGDPHHAATIATTSWVTPERRYYQSFGQSTIAGLLAQAAALGMTVVSASGDWGAFDGVPRAVVDGRPVMDAPWPNGVFPAVEERVLAVGGTAVTSLDPLTETGWSSPPPRAVAAFSPFKLLASGGGFSEFVPIPPWQRPVLRSYYDRGSSSPSVVPFGRGYPDVALMASGPVVQARPEEPLTSRGYQAVVMQQWIDYAGGTSIAAPIWAAIVARLNQASVAQGLPRLGHFNPLLYHLAAYNRDLLRQVPEGHSDVAMYAVNQHGRAVIYRVDGYRCRRGWDPVTGLGVPDVARLAAAVTEPTPRARGRG